MRDRAAAIALVVTAVGLPARAEPAYVRTLGDALVLWVGMLFLHALVCGLAFGIACLFVRRPGEGRRRRRVVVSIILSIVFIAAGWLSGIFPVAFVILALVGAGARTM